VILFLAGIFLLFAGGIVSLFLHGSLKPSVSAFFSFLSAAILSFVSLNVLFGGDTLKYSFSLPFPIGTVAIVIDPLSAFFILLISVMSFISLVYSIGYIASYKDKGTLPSHYFFLLLLICSMVCVAVVQNVVFFLIIWETMSLSSFFLVIFEDDKKEVLSAGMNYLIMMHISILFIMAGFMALSLHAGSPDFSAFSKVFAENGILKNAIFLCLFIGFGIKSGFVPFHNWLPKAHPAAPSHVSSIMSGVMIKTGIYGILRIIALMGLPTLEMSYFVVGISVVTALYGVLYAIAQHDIKRLLAYHSIENIGIIGIGIGVGMFGLVYGDNLLAVLGFTGALLHVLNHSIFKELLFLGAGSVYTKTRTRDIEKLGGLLKKMPCTGWLFLIGAFAIVGLPPLNGFVSEFIIYIGLLKGFEIKSLDILVIFILSFGSLAFVGSMALLCFTKVFGVAFLGEPRSKEAQQVNNDVSYTMLLPMILLALFIFAIGLFPQYAIKLTIGAAGVLTGARLPVSGIFPIHLMNMVSAIALVFLGLTGSVLLIRSLILANKKREGFKTWDCGYQAPNSRMQYTASSYAAPFLSLFNPFFAVTSDTVKPQGYFPGTAKFNEKKRDVIEYYFIRRLTGFIDGILKKFTWIQSGDTQLYILYGVIFLVVALIVVAVY